MTLTKSRFQNILFDWNDRENHRQMPWKGEKDPYRIWLSEIILQQTRVQQGLGYYERFISAYPSVHDLAQASEDDVLKLWQGLGYYSRARNLHFTAKDIVQNYEGKFPQSYAKLLKLKGVGKYTAAAIASFAFGEAVAAVDGNVIRVLSRIYQIQEPFDTADGRKQFDVLANELTPKNWPGIFNQAMMDFGATVCTPKKPLCELCPFQKDCEAFKNNATNDLPVRKNRVQSKSRFFFAFHIEKNGSIAIEQRKGKDIWQGLYQLPWQEVKGFDGNMEKQIDEVAHGYFQSENLNFYSFTEVFNQQLSHQKIHVIFVEIDAKNITDTQLNFIATRNLSTFAFPKIFILYLQGKKLILE
jgi:A/G-specific adenine glycosylase